MLSDFDISGSELDLASWDILEREDMPASWDRGASSEIFKLALELRTQAVLHHCKIEDGSFDVDEAGWSAALRTAFKPLLGDDKETKAKNKLLMKRHDQLEAHSKPTKKAALKQFAVNHLRVDAENQLHDLLPTLAGHFPSSFLEQLDADRERGSGSGNGGCWGGRSYWGGRSDWDGRGSRGDRNSWSSRRGWCNGDDRHDWGDWSDWNDWGDRGGWSSWGLRNFRCQWGHIWRHVHWPFISILRNRFKKI